MQLKRSKRLYIGAIIGLITVAIAAFLINEWRSKSQAVQAPARVNVKAMNVIVKDTPINMEFVGKVYSKNEVKIISKVSGNVIEKMVQGGAVVHKGQPLYRIDDKQYRSAVNEAGATLRKAQATLHNDQKDLERYQRLSSIDGIAQQTTDTQATQVREDEAEVETDQAKLQSAQEDLQDTMILSPVDGKIDVNDVSIGSYAAAGSTTLATVSSLDPVWVQFSMSETEYLDMLQKNNGVLPTEFRDQVKLTLSNGSEYAGVGHIEQVDKGISTTTGTILLKASFDNPNGLLMPGMFTRVKIPGEIYNNAILVPQKAIKETLENTFVMVVNAENKAEMRPVKLGKKSGIYVIVESGLQPGDVIVMEGIDKIKQGTELNIVTISPDALDTLVQE